MRQRLAGKTPGSRIAFVVSGAWWCDRRASPGAPIIYVDDLNVPRQNTEPEHQDLLAHLLIPEDAT